MALFEPVIDALDEVGARYVIVGGTAVVLHGYARLTADLDLVIDLEPARALEAVRALSAIGLRPIAPIEAGGIADPATRRGWIEDKGMTVLTLHDPGEPLLRVDLFTDEVVPFEDLLARSEEFRVGVTKMRVASIPDLIAMKRLAGRPRDLEDIEALEEIHRRRGAT